jgi:hypothetical protein
MKNLRLLGWTSDTLNLIQVAYDPIENKVLLIEYEQDLVGTSVKNIKPIIGLLPENEFMTPQILLKIYQAVCEKRYPLLYQRNLWQKMTDLEKLAIENACKSQGCENCPLLWTIGCYQLHTTEIEHLHKSKIIQFFFAKLTPIFGHDHIQSLFETGIGRTLSAVSGSPI